MEVTKEEKHTEVGTKGEQILQAGVPAQQESTSCAFIPGAGIGSQEGETEVKGGDGGSRQDGALWPGDEETHHAHP